MKQHILIVDDDKDELVLFEDALEKLPDDSGFECTYASNAEQALGILKYIVPDYIFVDFNMPGMDGLAFLFNLKEETTLRNTKIYLHSARITDDIYRTATLAGASGCIRKANSIQDLANELIPILVPVPKPASGFLSGKSGNW